MASLPPFDIVRFLQNLPTSPPPGGGPWLNNGVLTLAVTVPSNAGGVLNFSSPSNGGLIAAIIA